MTRCAWVASLPAQPLAVDGDLHRQLNIVGRGHVRQHHGLTFIAGAVDHGQRQSVDAVGLGDRKFVSLNLARVR